MATEAVYTFMKNQNRPYSLTEIQQNVSKEYGKAAIQKALNTLVEKDKLFEKTYGKQKAYCVVQEDASDGNTEEDLKAADREINALTMNLKEVQDKIKSHKAKLREMGNTISLADAKEQKMNLEEEIRSLKEELKKYDDDFKPIPEEERKKISDEFEKYAKEYRKRKGICREIIGQIMENYPKTEKKLYEEIGMETDEEAGFNFENILN